MREFIGSRLREERDRLGYNQGDFADAGGVSKRTLVDWEHGKTTPNAEFLFLISKVGADITYIVIGEPSGPGLAAEEKELLAGYRGLDIRGKAGVLGMIDGMSTPKPTVVSAAFVVHGKVSQQVHGNIEGKNIVNMKAKKAKKNLDK